MEPTERGDATESIDLAQLRDLALEAYQIAIAGKGKKDHEQHRFFDQLSKVVHDHKDDPGVRQVVDEVKREVYSIPDSMFLSDKAMIRLEQANQDLEIKIETIETYNYSDYLDDPNELLDNADYVFRSYSQVMIATRDGMVAGTTRFKQKAGELMVDQQQGVKDAPGVGLMMLKQVIEYAREQGMQTVSLYTFRIPKGLGNLGFEYDPDNEYITTMDYKLDLTKK